MFCSHSSKTIPPHDNVILFILEASGERGKGALGGGLWAVSGEK